MRSRGTTQGVQLERTSRMKIELGKGFWLRLAALVMALFMAIKLSVYSMVVWHDGFGKAWERIRSDGLGIVYLLALSLVVAAVVLLLLKLGSPGPTAKREGTPAPASHVKHG
jgi:hypothetical protein